MSTDRFKKLVEQIQKTAQVPGRTKGVKAPAPAAPAAPASGTPVPEKAPVSSGVPTRGGRPAHPVGAGGGSVPAVKTMQIAMQNLAKLISNTIDYNKLQQTMTNPASGNTKKDFDSSYGRDAFSNFMVNRYLRNSNTKGVEFDPDPNKKKMEEKNPSDLKNMFIVLDGLKRIGPSSKEFATDGIWGPRTNNGLKNISAIADAIMKLGKDLGMQSSSFDASKLSALTPLIPDDDKSISLQEKMERAPKITELLNGVQALFKDFKEQVFQKPAYMNLIDGREPLFKFNPADKQGTPDVSGGEKVIYDDLKTNGQNSRFTKNQAGQSVPVATVNINPQFTGGKPTTPVQFTGADLLNQQSFIAALTRNPSLKSLQQSNPNTFSNIITSTLDQVQEQINTKLSSQPAPQAAPPQAVAQQPAGPQNQPKAQQ